MQTNKTLGRLSHNLALLKRLFHLLEIRKVTDIGANPLCGRAECADSIGNSKVNLHGVSR